MTAEPVHEKKKKFCFAVLTDDSAHEDVGDDTGRKTTEGEKKSCQRFDTLPVTH